MTIEETEAYTGYSKSYLYKLTSGGKIPHYKPMGGRVFFKREELDDFMCRGRMAADYELAEKAEAILTRGRV